MAPARLQHVLCSCILCRLCGHEHATWRSGEGWQMCALSIHSCDGGMCRMSTRACTVSAVGGAPCTWSAVCGHRFHPAGIRSGTDVRLVARASCDRPTTGPSSVSWTVTVRRAWRGMVRRWSASTRGVGRLIFYDSRSRSCDCRLAQPGLSPPAPVPPHSAYAVDSYFANESSILIACDRASSPDSGLRTEPSGSAGCK
jgi:hypothetical protein